ADRSGSAGDVAKLVVLRERLQRPVIGSGPRLDEPTRGRRSIEACEQSVERGEVEIAVAPLENLDRVVAVIFDLGDKLAVERIGVAGHAESAVVHIATGTTGDLADL